MKNKGNSLKYLFFILLDILLILFIYIVPQYKTLVSIIILLTLLNILMFIKLFKNNSMSSFIWSGIEKWIKDFKNEEKSSYYIQREVFNKENIEIPIDRNYLNLIDKINYISLDLKKSAINIRKNEKVNMELINNLTNKLNKPLEDIDTNINKLKLEEDNDDAIKILKIKSNNLKKLVEELFEASKTATGDMEIELNDIEVIEFLKQATIEIEDKLLDKNLIIKSSFPNEGLYISCSGEMLWRVFDIIFENIVKHSLENSRIYLDVKREDEKIHIILKNTSKKELNIDPKDLVYLINSNKSEDVSGLGLEIAKNLVLLQKGDFKINIDGDLFKVIITFNIKLITEASLDKVVN
ncbi:sensor histidine kinase [Clostridium nigeriense]|uniref:sensor histidine kinase n=1 Tax=Clostridium nigeriense TaxID=1805470 RepID=UPI003D34D6F5